MLETLLHALIVYSITSAAPKVPTVRAHDIADMIVRESTREQVDPVLVVAVMWHESGFRNLPVNATKDRGLMQVHWSPGAPWLAGLSPRDLMDPATNVRAGVRELAWWRGQHEKRCDDSKHFWWAHYKWGYRVKDRRYGRAIHSKVERSYRLFL